MKGVLFEILSVGLIIAGLFFFHQATRFLAGGEYLGAILTVFIGFVLVKVSVDLARLAVITRKED